MTDAEKKPTAPAPVPASAYKDTLTKIEVVSQFDPGKTETVYGGWDYSPFTWDVDEVFIGEYGTRVNLCTDLSTGLRRICGGLNGYVRVYATGEEARRALRLAAKTGEDIGEETPRSGV